MVDLSFYKNKKVFITGHTGFKGSWLCHILKNEGAVIKGYSLRPEELPNLFQLSALDCDPQIESVEGDIRDLDKLKKAVNTFQPEIMIHMAAQPLVRDSYDNPHYTYETNVMGTVNILEALRSCKSVRSFLNVTTDKVYENKEWVWGYRENEPLDGYDPYSNSKSCSELVTHSYQKSFFSGEATSVAISTARAGNVIGGGDFAKDRIIPDCIRAAMNHKNIIVRNPHSTRPYQHVLEPLFAYLLILEKQYIQPERAGYYNVGPNEEDCITTGKLVGLFCEKWQKNQRWEDRFTGGPHEANFLKLDCSHIKTVLGWQPRWNVETAIEKTVEWTKCYQEKEDIRQIMKVQIDAFIANK
ncbi:MAG: CDP-glucose 4,6-dehydratase [Eubacterium sp.]